MGKRRKKKPLEKPVEEGREIKKREETQRSKEEKGQELKGNPQESGKEVPKTR